MCGIVYAHSFLGESVAENIIQTYKGQRTRGHDGFGFYLPQLDRLTHNTREGRTLSLLNRTITNEIMFHHRYPTSTVNTRKGCHPYSTKNFFPDHSYVLVHNGVLRNEDVLRRKHEDFGVKYVSDVKQALPSGVVQDKYNDSESLLWEVALFLEGYKDSMDAIGTIAFIVCQLDKDKKPVALYFARNSGNPLKIQYTKTGLSLSSAGEGREIPQDVLHRFDYATREITTQPLDIKRYFPGGGTNYSSHNHNWRNSNTAYTPNSAAAKGWERSQTSDASTKVREAITAINSQNQQLLLSHPNPEKPQWIPESSIPDVNLWEKTKERDKFYPDCTDASELITQRINHFGAKYNEPLEAYMAIVEALEDNFEVFTQLHTKMKKDKGLFADECRAYIQAAYEATILQEASELISSMVDLDDDELRELDQLREGSDKVPLGSIKTPAGLNQG